MRRWLREFFYDLAIRLLLRRAGVDAGVAELFAPRWRQELDEVTALYDEMVAAGKSKAEAKRSAAVAVAERTPPPVSREEIERLDRMTSMVQG